MGQIKPINCLARSCSNISRLKTYAEVLRYGSNEATVIIKMGTKSSTVRCSGSAINAIKG